VHLFTRPQVKTYLLILVSNLIWVMIDYSLTATICTGTGMGGNQVLRLCQDEVPWLLFALNVLIFVGVLGLVRVFKPSPVYRNKIIAFATIVIFVLPFFLSKSTFLRTPI
jgi:hypothetical protein